MAATYFDIQYLPKNPLAGFQHTIRVTARNADGTVDTGYVGTVTFSSTDALAVLPAAYTFVGGDAGTHLFKVKLMTVGAHTLTVTDSVILAFTGRVSVATRAPGWGLDDRAFLPYGDAASGIGAYLVRALLVSTREVEIEVSNLVQDNSPFLAGDALNPATWTVQRLDTAAFLHPVAVTQTGTYKYLVMCLEEFGTVAVTHRISSSTLKDLAGADLLTPRSADFLGVQDAAKATTAAVLAGKKVSSRDIANPQTPNEAEGFFSGTLQLDGAGDYRLESGAALVKKLILRRLMSKPGDFFHLPNYGEGLRVKEPIPSSDLGRLKTAIEKQCMEEREVSEASASLTFDPSKGVLYIRIRAALLTTGESVEIGFNAGNNGLVL